MSKAKKSKRRIKSIAAAMQNKGQPQPVFDVTFSRLQHLIKNRNPLSLVIVASTKLHEVEDGDVQAWRVWRPWDLLLLIRWAFEYGDWASTSKPLATLNDLTRLMNLVDRISSSKNPFLQAGGIAGLQKFLRTLSFQQIWLQTPLDRWALARPCVLFGDLPETHILRKSFLNATGMSMEEFMEMTIILYVWIDKHKEPLVPFTIFNQSHYSEEKIERFLNIISLTPEQVPEYFRGRKQAVKNPFLQRTEVTPLIRHPLLRLKQGYWLYGRRVYEEAMRTLVYDILKSLGEEEFGDSFGPIMERYVEQSLQQAKQAYYNEKILAQHLTGKKVDFVLPLEECTTLVEVKATELRPSVQVYPEKQQITGELEDNVLKAIVQGFKVASDFANGIDTLPLLNRSNFYLLIVTYRDLHLGPFVYAWEEFIREAITPDLEAEGLQPLISPDKIIVLSLSEFELLVSILSGGEINLATILQDWSERVLSSDLSTMPGMFVQHLEKYQIYANDLTHLDQALYSLIEDAAAKLPK